ncbi:hypothetical protein DMENIID0001_125780 [Sergentomyia squamirostris]
MRSFTYLFLSTAFIWMASGNPINDDYNKPVQPIGNYDGDFYKHFGDYFEYDTVNFPEHDKPVVTPMDYKFDPKDNVIFSTGIMSQKTIQESGKPITGDFKTTYETTYGDKPTATDYKQFMHYYK